MSYEFSVKFGLIGGVNIPRGNYDFALGKSDFALGNSDMGRSKSNIALVADPPRPSTL